MRYHFLCFSIFFFSWGLHNITIHSELMRILLDLDHVDDDIIFTKMICDDDDKDDAVNANRGLYGANRGAPSIRTRKVHPGPKCSYAVYKVLSFQVGPNCIILNSFLTRWKSITTPDTSYTVTGLEPNTLYQFEVKLRTNEGESPYSVAIFERTEDGEKSLRESASQTGTANRN